MPTARRRSFSMQLAEDLGMRVRKTAKRLGYGGSGPFVVDLIEAFLEEPRERLPKSITFEPRLTGRSVLTILVSETAFKRIKLEVKEHKHKSIASFIKLVIRWYFETGLDMSKRGSCKHVVGAFSLTGRLVPLIREQLRTGIMLQELIQEALECYAVVVGVKTL